MYGKVGFDFEDLGNIEFFVVWVGLQDIIIIISYFLLKTEVLYKFS